jgi:fido (protein-threonine AMPylation protein)
MCDARAHIVDRLDALADGPAFVELLRQAHVLSLMGSTLDSYYQPASPSADQRVAPGNFFQAEPRVLRRAGCNVFVDGPRVNVSLAGAQGYHRALLGDLGDEPAGDDERDHVVDGVSWGSVLVARAEKDDRARSWFCPPRPIRAEHLETLRCHAQQASLRQSHAQVIESCALFHQAFVRLHPFHCANQSLAMNWVNALLSRSLGAGIPHLTLDLLALRLEPHAYARLFQRAVASWIVHEPDPVWRFAVLRERKNRSQSLIARVSACTSDPERDTLIGSDPEAARWALLRG